MKFTVARGASVYKNEDVQITLKPTKNKGGGNVVEVPVPENAFYDITVASDQLTPVNMQVPLGFRIISEGIPILSYPAAGRHNLTIPVSSIQASSRKKLTFDFDTISVPESNIRINIILRGGPVSAPVFQTPVQTVTFRLKQGTRMPQEPAPEQPELPDGLEIVSVEALTQDEPS